MPLWNYVTKLYIDLLKRFDICATCRNELHHSALRISQVVSFFWWLTGLCHFAFAILNYCFSQSQKKKSKRQIFISSSPLDRKLPNKHNNDGVSAKIVYLSNIPYYYLIDNIKCCIFQIQLIKLLQCCLSKNKICILCTN